MSTSISATEIGLPDNAKLKLGTGEDLEIYHDGSNSYLKNGTGVFNLQGSGSNIQLQAVNGESGLIVKPDNAVELYFNGGKKFETTSDGVKLASLLDIKPSTYTNIEDNSAYGLNIKHMNEKPINIATGGDYIQIYDLTSSKLYIRCEHDAGVKLYNNNSTKLETISTGLNVTGGVRLGGNNSANELDDYETGSWTPVVGGWDTFSPYSGSSYYAGWYVKVGESVHVGWKIYIQNLTTVSSSAHIRVSGLPFASKTVSAGPVAHVRFDIPEFGHGGEFLTYLGGNETIIYMYNHASGANHLTAINATANRSNVWCMGSANYTTDA